MIAPEMDYQALIALDLGDFLDALFRSVSFEINSLRDLEPMATNQVIGGSNPSGRHFVVVDPEYPAHVPIGMCAVAHRRTLAHAFMVETLAHEAERSELRERFAAAAADSEREAIAAGKTYPLATTFDYLESRMAGAKAKRPRTRRWRASK